MARKPSASEKRQSPNIAAAISAANELTARTAQNTQYVSHLATGLREFLETYRDTANPDLPHGLRITRLDVDLEYGVTHHDASTMVERNEGVTTPARDLANGMLHIAVKGAPPQAINLSLFLESRSDGKDAELYIMVGNRDGEVSDPHLFIMKVDEAKPASFVALHKAKGERMSLIERLDPISILDYIGQKIQDMVVNKRTPALIAQEKLAA